MTDSRILEIDGLARELVRLRREGKQVPTSWFPVLPTDFQGATETQKLVSEQEGVSGDAWKVAISPDKDFVVAPLHPYTCVASGSILPWRRGMKLEVEIAVRLGRELAVKSEGACSRSELVSAISEVYLGAEFIWTSVEEGGQVSFLLFLADRLGNMGYVLGPVLPASMLDTGTGLPLRVSLDDRTLHDAEALHPAGDVLTWLLGYINNTSRSQMALTADSVITTGSLCGALEIAEPGRIAIKLGSEATLDFLLSAEV